jgi:hypothetical protein
LKKYSKMGVFFVTIFRGSVTEIHTVGKCYIGGQLWGQMGL